MGAALVQGISSAGNLISTALQIHANRKADERQNQWSIEAQNRANAENERFWNLQNDYNSPNAQMQRLKMAGLNPNLVYGNGVTTQAGNIAPSKAAPMRSTSNAPAFAHIASTIGQALQNDNLRAQNTVLLQEASLKASKTANEAMSYAKSSFDLNLAKELKQNSLEVARNTLQKLIDDAQISRHTSEIKLEEASQARNKTDWENATYQSRVSKTVTDAAVAAQTLKGKELENALLDYEKQLNDMWLNTKDPRVRAALMFVEKLTSKFLK